MDKFSPAAALDTAAHFNGTSDEDVASAWRVCLAAQR